LSNIQVTTAYKVMVPLGADRVKVLASTRSSSAAVITV